MAKDRPPDWMPNFNYTTSRPHPPSSSAPAHRFCRASSNPPGSGDNSDDDEYTSMTNRCSPKAVYAMVSKLSEFKKQMVRDIGFGGILELPSINKVNLKLSAWLLTKLDTEDSELVLSESKRIYIHEKDVGIVFGIPCGEIDVTSIEITQEQIESIRASCGIVSKDPRSFKGVEYVLEKHLDDRSTRLELDSFKMAFVIFVMAHLLAPSGKHDNVNLDFWGALKDTELLYRMNWCRYVYSHVLDAAQKARDEMIRKNRITNLLGCHLFLQVIFLDSVDIRGLNKKHDIIPRISLFDADSLKKMATMCESRGGNDFNSFIAIRSAEGSAYMRHIYQSAYAVPRRNTTPLTPPPLPAGSTASGSPDVLSAETYCFREHADFGAYIRTRYPNMNQLYAIDYMKMHNAKMFREITLFRSSVMRLNAMLLDWLVSNVDTRELAKIHKKPTPSLAAQLNVNSPSVRSVPVVPHVGTELKKQPLPGEPTSSVSAFDNCAAGAFSAIQGGVVSPAEVSTAITLKRPAVAHDGPLLKKPRLQIDTSSGLNPCIGKAVAASSMTPKCDAIPRTSGTTDTTAIDQKTPVVKKQHIDIVTEVPSFDLGIDTSPVQGSYLTPKSQVLPKKSVISPIPFPASSPYAYQTSHLNEPLSPISATVSFAKELVHDMLDSIDDGSNQNEYVVCGKPITENFYREPFPLTPLPCPSWPSPHDYYVPDSDVLHMLHIYVREAKHIDDRSLWIVHPRPKQLVLSAKDIKDNFLTPMLTEFHIVDAIIRRFNQVDVSIKEGKINVRWRHFMETDFAMLAIAGFQPDLTQSVLNQFIHMDYTVGYCKKIIIPVLVNDIWSAYMFDMDEQVVHILDPAHSTERHEAHAHFQKVIYASMANCFHAFYTGLDFPTNKELQVMYPKLCDIFPSEDSAFCMLHLARYFNGEELQVRLDKDDLHRVRTTWMYEALSLQHNEAVLPGMLARLTKHE